jgi:hypothetical protein
MCLVAYPQVGLQTSILTRLLIYRPLRPDDVNQSVTFSWCRPQNLWWVELGSFHSHSLHLSEMSGQIQAPAALLPEKGHSYELMGEDLRRTGQSCLGDVLMFWIRLAPVGFLRFSRLCVYYCDSDTAFFLKILFVIQEHLNSLSKLGGHLEQHNVGGWGYESGSRNRVHLLLHFIKVRSRNVITETARRNCEVTGYKVACR